ncbi:hypothetical protein STENM327S_01237 [Streptomyces tendae]
MTPFRGLPAGRAALAHGAIPGRGGGAAFGGRPAHRGLRDPQRHRLVVEERRPVLLPERTGIPVRLPVRGSLVTGRAGVALGAQGGHAVALPTTGASPADLATASWSPHSTSQLASIRCPCSVSTDSGWNCTPSTSSSR